MKHLLLLTHRDIFRRSVLGNDNPNSVGLKDSGCGNVYVIITVTGVPVTRGMLVGLTVTFSCAPEF